MIEFDEFARAMIVVQEIFGCLRDDNDTTVQVYAKSGGIIPLSGEESRLFLRFARECIRRRHADDDQSQPPAVYTPETAPRPTPGEARKSAP